MPPGRRRPVPGGRSNGFRRLAGPWTLGVIARGRAPRRDAGARPGPTGEPDQAGPNVACTDVASGQGRFRGDYGLVYATPDDMGRVMQRNLGNGAAVGDYDVDGDLDVLLPARPATTRGCSGTIRLPTGDGCSRT